MDIINVVAIMLAPIVSVIIGQFLLNKSEKRKADHGTPVLHSNAITAFSLLYLIDFLF